MENNKRTSEQNKAFHLLVKERKFDKSKVEKMVLHYSGGVTEHSSELTESQMAALIAELQDGIQKSLNRMRTKINQIARGMGLIQGNDFSRLNKFVQKTFKVETIFKLPADDLRNCITALERWKQQAAKR
ncbi:hypothetical protein [Pseudarcicella hirudinis]|nr:hypothetical protein [Pseudarcicella hirudinis]